jgi:hypothetical protein
MAVLSFEEHFGLAARIVDREHNNGAAMVDNVPASAHSSWFDDIIGSDLKYRAFVGNFRRDDTFKFISFARSEFAIRTI